MNMRRSLVITEYDDGMIVIDGYVENTRATGCIVSLNGCKANTVELIDCVVDIVNECSIKYLYVKNSRPFYNGGELKNKIGKLKHMTVDRYSSEFLHIRNRYESLTMIGFEFDRNSKLPLVVKLTLINCTGSLTGKFKSLEFRGCVMSGVDIYVREVGLYSGTEMENVRIFTRKIDISHESVIHNFEIIEETKGE